MKILVAYFSQTGNTKKIAEAIYEAIPQDKEIKELKDIESISDYDLTFIGFPIHAFGPAEDAKKFLNEKVDGKKIALFITHAAPEESDAIQPWIESSSKAANGATIIGSFDCQGELAQPIMDMLLQSDDPNMRSFGEAGPSTKGQPDESRVEKAKIFAADIVKGM